MVDGLTGPNFTLTAKDGYISTGRRQQRLFLGIRQRRRRRAVCGPDPDRDPGPDGHRHAEQRTARTDVYRLPRTGECDQCGRRQWVDHARSAGQIGAGPAGTVTYRFVASQPGTYQYHSGTRPDLQLEMGLVGR